METAKKIVMVLVAAALLCRGEKSKFQGGRRNLLVNCLHS
jgi:hypothetical protein